jgi:hypothetical protein
LKEVVVMSRYRAFVAGLMLAFGSPSAGFSDFLTFDSAADWAAWDIPRGLVSVGGEGQLELVRFRKNIDAVVDAPSFVHKTRANGDVFGGVWNAGSSVATAQRIIDGDPSTYWKPSGADDLSQWTIEIDLGRAVLAKEIRLTFPDEDGARPFRQFAVFVATGATIQGTDDVFRYDQVFRTTRPNTETDLRIIVDGARDTTRIVDNSLDVQLGDETRHRTVQYVLIQADEANLDGALAELSVLAAGDNISIGTLDRGGSFTSGALTGLPQNMFDGSMDTNAGIVTVTYGGRELRGWEESGVWWEVDLGALFWLDELYIYNKQRGEALSSFQSDRLNSGSGFQILASDGTRTISGGIDYELLIREPEPNSTQESEVLQFRYLFKPRKIQHLFFHALFDRDWFTHPMEFMLFNEGYPARVVARSEFIDLGEVKGDLRPKALKGISWDVDLTPGTRMQMRTRSGNELGEFYEFFNKAGENVSEEKWASLPAVVRGPVDTMVTVDESWSPWSNEYQLSGEIFKSPSPRRYVQLEVILSTEDRSVTPILNSLSLEFDDALVRESHGTVSPRTVTANVDTEFVYTLVPSSSAGDRGFNLVRLVAPGPLSAPDIWVDIGQRRVVPAEIAISGDSLTIALAEVVASDSVEIGFRTRVLENAFVIDVDIAHSELPGLWQSVEPATSRSNVVLLPDLPGSNALIRDLSINPVVMTPNGDGVNEQLELQFAVLKVASSKAIVRIFDLSGRQVAVLPQGTGTGVVTFKWSGTGDHGRPVAPGMYVASIEIHSDSGTDRVVRSFAVAY